MRVLLITFLILGGSFLVAQPRIVGYYKQPINISTLNNLLAPGSGMTGRLNQPFFVEYLSSPRFVESQNGQVLFQQKGSYTALLGPNHGKQVILNPDTLMANDLRDTISVASYATLEGCAPPFNTIKRCVDSTGHIWMIAPRKIIHCDGISRKQILPYVVGIKSTRFFDMEVGPDGAIWLAGNKDIARYKAGKWMSFASQPGMCKGKYLGLEIETGGQVWVYSKKEICAFNGETWTTYSEKEVGPVLPVQELKTDKHGRIWALGGEAGMPSVSMNDQGTWRPQESLANLPNVAIRSLQEDSKRRMWAFLVDGRIAKLEAETWKVYGVEDGLIATGFTVFVEDRYDNLWFIHSGAMGVFHDERFICSAGTPLTSFDAMEDADGSTWIYGYQGVMQWKGDSIVDHSEAAGFPPRSTFALIGTSRTNRNGLVGLHQDKTGHIWLTRYTVSEAETELVVLNVQHLVESGGLAVFDGTEWQDLSENQSLQDKRILAWYQDQKGQIWLDSPSLIYKLVPEAAE